jgi:hypothetical protein
MSSKTVQIYHEPHINSEVEGTAKLHRDVADRYWLNNVKIVSASNRGSFTALDCTDCQTHYVQTSMLEQVEADSAEGS